MKLYMFVEKGCKDCDYVLENYLKPVEGWNDFIQLMYLNDGNEEAEDLAKRFLVKQTPTFSMFDESLRVDYVNPTLNNVSKLEIFSKEYFESVVKQAKILKSRQNKVEG